MESLLQDCGCVDMVLVYFDRIIGITISCGQLSHGYIEIRNSEEKEGTGR
jgi:hypothetical protein